MQAKPDRRRIRVIIKGNAGQAREAAKARGLDLIVNWETHRGEVLGHVGAKHEAAIYTWFGEPEHAPYPAGSLLHFTLPEG